MCGRSHSHWQRFGPSVTKATWGRPPAEVLWRVWPRRHGDQRRFSEQPKCVFLDLYRHDSGTHIFWHCTKRQKSCLSHEIGVGAIDSGNELNEPREALRWQRWWVPTLRLPNPTDTQLLRVALCCPTKKITVVCKHVDRLWCFVGG